MSRHILARTVSAAALMLALGATHAAAQQPLPRIDIGAAPRHAKHAAPTRHVAARAPVARTTAPAPSAPAPQPTPVAQPQPAPTPPIQSAREAPVTSSSTRTASGAEVNSRIYSQPGEALEIVPGLIVAQHSGAGKANQYFLRGFALDHGFDIGLTIDGMPINQPSHVHSNGYADANFLIPELFSSVDIRKGPYFADEGAFSSVGAVHMQYVDKLREGLVHLSGGSFVFGDALVAKSWAVGDGELLAALEGNIYNGPWQRPDEERKISGVARWSKGTQENGLSITAMAYSNHYFATDQIPFHLVSMGLMSRWDTQDPTDGGNAARYSLSARWSQTNTHDFSRVEAFAVRNDTHLYDNFTYQLGNPITLAVGGLLNGDQSHQFDHRSLFGFNALHGWNYTLMGVPSETRVGLQTTYNQIHNGNGDSYQRFQYDEIKNSAIKEFMHGAWTDTTLRWTPWFRTTAGFRLDYVHGSVNSVANPIAAQGWMVGQPAYMGSANDGELGRWFTSPKAGVVFGPFKNAADGEIFMNFGEGFRAEDMRGATNHFMFDGTNFNYIYNVQLLTKTRGGEIGARAKPIEGLDTTLSLFWQDFDAENQFNADAGTSVVGRPGRRLGFEWTGKYSPTSWLRFDGEVTGTHARFKGYDWQQMYNWVSYVGQGINADTLFPLGLPGLAPGNYLSLAPVWVATGGVEVGEKTGWFGGLRYRYFGSRPLTEDGYLQSPATGTLNARVGYRFENGWKIQLDGLNITNSRSDAIDYQANVFGKQDYTMFPWYAGGSGLGISERTFKPVDPPAFRLTVSGPLSVFEGGPILANLENH